MDPPSFSTLLVIQLVFIIIYLANENSSLLHGSSTRESIFWFIHILVASVALSCARGSPLRVAVQAQIGAYDADTDSVSSYARLVLFLCIQVSITASYLLAMKTLTDRTTAKYRRHASIGLAPRGLVSTSDAARTLKSRRRSSVALSKASSSSASSALMKRLDADTLLNKLTYTSMIRYVASAARGRVRERQQRLQALLQQATPTELEHLVRSLDITKMFHVGDVFNSLSKADRLSVPAKVALLHAMMRVGALFHRRNRELAVNIFLSAKGQDLASLKNLLDGSGDAHSLYKLVFQDLRGDEDLRDAVLAHILNEAGELARNEDASRRRRRLKIVSDIDDTFWSSQGRWPAGVDETHPKHAVYPGVCAFLEELDMNGTREKASAEEKRLLVSLELPFERGGGITTFEIDPATSIQDIRDRIEEDYSIPSWRQKYRILEASEDADGNESQDVLGHVSGARHNLVFLSARPHSYKDFSESPLYQRFHVLYELGRLHTSPSVLSGSLRSGFHAVVGDFVIFSKNAARDAVELVASLGLGALDSDVLGKFLKANVPIKTLDGVRAKLESLARIKRLDDDEEEALDLLEVVTEDTSRRSWERVGEYKALMFDQYARLYPEFHFLFIGDDGQGDVLAAERIASKLGGWESPSGSPPLSALIHRVYKGGKCLSGLDSEAERNAFWNENGIRFFDTYAGAALLAYRAGLVDARGLRRVAVAVREETESIWLEHPDFKAKLDVNELVNRDLALVNEALSATDVHAGVPLLPA